MSPRGREPEASLSLSLPPAQLAEMRQVAGQLGCWAGVCPGPSPGCNPRSGGLQPVMAPQQSLCTEISAYLSIKPFAPSFSLAWL